MTVVRIPKLFCILWNIFIVYIYKIVMHLLNMQFYNTFILEVFKYTCFLYYETKTTDFKIYPMLYFIE